MEELTLYGWPFRVYWLSLGTLLLGLVMDWKKFFNTPEEIFIGATLQFPLYFVVGWWVLPIMLACGFLWRMGGVEGGNKLYRRLGVTSLVCFSTFLAMENFGIFLAIPFMVWIAPSYGKATFLYKLFSKLSERKADFLTRSFTYLWYWMAYTIAFIIPI